MTTKASLRQQRLADILRHASGPIRVDDVVRALNLGRAHAAKLLAGWHRQGVIRRVARGLYVPVQPTALGQTQVLENPWILVPELYSPGYVGGWSALEHWGLTEQLFRSVCVLSAKRITRSEVHHQGVSFFIRHIPERLVFGTKTVWIGSTRVMVSDPCKTLLDIIDDPYLGAGLQHVADCLREFRVQFPGRDEQQRLLDYALRIGNGALFKKLGFLAERLGFGQSLVDACAEHLTTGYTRLDKQAKAQRLVTRWRLWVPKGFAE